MTAASTDPGLYCCVLELSAGLYTPRSMVNALYGSLESNERMSAKEDTAIAATTMGYITSNASNPYFIEAVALVGIVIAPTR